MDESKETCIERLEKAEDRPDKANWRAVIEKWFQEHGEMVPQNKAKKFWRFIKNEAGERILRLEGIISENSWADDEISPNKFREELNSITGDITVWLNSEGGDFWAGVQIYNMLKEYSGRVTIKIDAIAASAASVIAMAGDVVEISAAGMIMIHNPWSFAEGDATQMKSAAGMLEEVKESLITAYVLKTHLPREELSRMMDEETWLHAKKAVELGFADKIIGDEIAPEIEISSRRKVMNCLPKVFRSKAKSDARKIAAKYYRKLYERKP